MMTAAQSTVALGTTRAPKVRATERAVAEVRRVVPDFLSGLRIEPRQVDSGAPATPMDTEAMMRGAENRARNARAAVSGEGLKPVLSIGLEGGLSSERGIVFLESWAFVMTAEAGFFGSSGRISLPERLAQAVLENGEDLGSAADRLFARSDVAGQEGTFGVLTRGAVSREDAFVRALLHALAPFYNAEAFQLG